MMDEWEKYGGRINLGALRRWSYKMQKQVSYEHWLGWIDEDRKEELLWLSYDEAIDGLYHPHHRWAVEHIWNNK